ncbi:AraC family transcriptional regulator [Luteolibacter sp. AS25]|uniref:AraC family transcriptional regulator n=1 Tax=Luteolibacter sp. AS25 TaxID=3135776 RepID=UPI00398A5BB4
MDFEPSQLQEAVSLIAAGLAGAGDSRVKVCSGLRFWSEDREGAPEPMIFSPSLIVIVQGSVRVILPGEVRDFGPSHYFLSTLTVPVNIQVTNASAAKPLLGLIIDLDLTCVSQLLSIVGEEIALESAPVRLPAVLPTAIDRDFYQSFLRLLRCTQSNLDWRVLSEGMKREMFYRVLRGPSGHILRKRIESNTPIQKVACAIVFIQRNLSELLEIKTIARHVGVSVSSLHAHFNSVVGESPLRYIKCLRLHRAQGLLQSGNDVIQSALEVGYSSASQFSREYKRKFGEPPSLTRKRGQ